MNEVEFTEHRKRLRDCRFLDNFVVLLKREHYTTEQCGKLFNDIVNSSYPDNTQTKLINILEENTF